MGRLLTALVCAGLLAPGALSADIDRRLDDRGVGRIGSAPPARKPGTPVKVTPLSKRPPSASSSSTEKTVGEARPATRPAPRVQLYTTSWCGYCQKARSFLQAKGIDYVEYDVERDAAASGRFKAYGGRGVPLAVINGNVVHGFSESAYEGALGPK